MLFFFFGVIAPWADVFFCSDLDFAFYYGLAHFCFIAFGALFSVDPGSDFAGAYTPIREVDDVIH